MHRLTVIPTIYIVIVSSMLIISSIQSSFRRLFQSDSTYRMHFEPGWELHPKKYLFIALNFIPLIGLCLTLFINYIGNRKKDSY